MKTEHALRREVKEASQLLWQRGWVANHDGNITARVSPGRFVATPTAMSKRVIDEDKLIVVDDAGKVIRGRFRVFSEMGLHRLVYRTRPDVGCVIHAHPPHATALAMLEKSLRCFLPESVVSLGPEVPCVPFALPGEPAEKALAPFVETYDAVLLGRHGALAWGDDVEQAYLRLELVEHLANISQLAKGAVPGFTDEAMAKLLEARTKAGLGPAGRKAAQSNVTRLVRR